MAEKFVALIPARGGSKSIPFKNIKEINGRPLIYWVIDAAINSELIDEVYVATDSEEIKTKINNYKFTENFSNLEKLKVVSRSPYTATDEASTESVMLEFANNHSFSHIVLIQATSPLLESNDLTNGINKYIIEGYDSLLSVVKQKRFLWLEEGSHVKPYNYNPAARPRRQENQGIIVENGAFYITSKANLIAAESRLSGRIGIYEMPEYTSCELDEADDWIIIEKLLACKKKKKSVLNEIKLFATDCDGVLTDAGMYYSESGDELKKFNTRDGMGFGLLRNSNIITAIITSEEIELVKRRAKKLKIDEVCTGVANKVEVMDKLVEKHKIDYSNVLYIGDDLNDIELLDKVGFSCAVADANEKVKEKVNYVTKKRGGQGAVREVIDLIISNRLYLGD
jgi:N-acylneuraminate cytidylyltransferase